MDYKIKGKTALVTGAADGCGKAIAEKLGAEGAKVILHDLDSKREQLKVNAEKIGNGAGYVTADLSSTEQIESMWARLGEIDILVNNAGIWPTAYVTEMTPESFKKTLDIDLVAPFLLCKLFVNQCL